MASNPQAAAMLAYVDALHEKTTFLDLTTLATAALKTTIHKVARLMKQRKVTAICATDDTTFMNKDIALRVIAAALDVGICSIIRVMTPHPDTVPTMTVYDALKYVSSTPNQFLLMHPILPRSCCCGS